MRARRIKWLVLLCVVLVSSPILAQKFDLKQCLEITYNQFTLRLLNNPKLINVTDETSSEFLEIKSLFPLDCFNYIKQKLSNPYMTSGDFSFDMFSLNIDNFKRLKSLLTRGKREPLRYLEIGVYEGASLIWVGKSILNRPFDSLVAIDLFEEPLFEKFKTNIRKHGLHKRVTFHKGFSQEILKKDLGQFDLIYIDGSHLASDALQDLVLAWPKLKTNGYLVYDDYMYLAQSLPESLVPMGAMKTFVQIYRNELKIELKNHQVILKKISNPCTGKEMCTHLFPYSFDWLHNKLYKGEVQIKLASKIIQQLKNDLKVLETNPQHSSDVISKHLPLFKREHYFLQ